MKLILTEENHNEYYHKGVELLEPYILLMEASPAINKDAKKSIVEGIRYLDAVTEINQHNFAAFWIKGKGYQALGNHEDAYTQFEKSFRLNKNNPDVARELALECINLGKGEQAVEFMRHALTLDSTDPGLVANLALAYLINGNLDLASSTVEKAITLAPTDEINHNLKKIIDEVIAGQRAQPKKYEDLNI